MQKCQKLFIPSICAIVEACEKSTGDVRTTLTHALVLALVLSCVNNCKIEFDFEPSPARNNFTPEYKFSPPEQQTIDNEIDTFLSKSIIERSTSQTGEIISPIFLRPKKEPEKFRVILTLRILMRQ